MLRSCLMYESNCSTVLHLLCQDFCFMMLHMFLIDEESDLQASPSGSWTPVLEATILLLWQKQTLCVQGHSSFRNMHALFSRSKLPRPWALMDPHTIKVAGFGTLHWPHLVSGLFKVVKLGFFCPNTVFFWASAHFELALVQKIFWMVFT